MESIFLRRKALALALLPIAMPLTVVAQDRKAVEEVVVTGSLIKGTPENAALPVEVFSSADLQAMGDPSPLEFVKNLSISGPTTGEAYYFSCSALTNSVQYNLRGIGRDKTLTLFNGRRAFQNAVVYPSGAIDRIEILKDGAAVTYGADATGGVVNVITKDKFDGFEASTSYKTYDGSDQGEWKIGGTAGFNTEYANLLFVAEWDHRSELHSYDRRFTRNPYGVNPSPSSTLTNLAAWLPRQAMPAGAPTQIPGNTNNAGEWGLPAAGLINDFNQGSCEAVGGIYVPGASNFNNCAYNYIPYYNLVEENDVRRFFAQLTTKISDSADFHLRALWAQNSSPHQYGSPSQPVIRGPALTTGATYQLYVPSANPYVADLRANSGFAGGAAGFTPVTYRAFAHGGNDTFASADNHSTPNANDTKYWHITGGVSGSITDTISYDVAATFNQFKSVNSQPDLLGFRVQEALNGFGGPNCRATDLDPTRFGTQNAAAAGTNGCQWYNPFASNFARQPTLGLANPNFRANSQNPRDLVEWLFNKRESEDIHYDFTFDAVFSGTLPLTLPGGDIGWGLGGQYRSQKNRETVQDPLYNGQTPCDWPGQNPAATTDPRFTGCTLDQAGPYLFFANNQPDASQQIQQSYFAEVALPVFDSLSFTAAGRFEKFEPIGLDATVYKLSGKWQVIESFALRGSYGTNYQAPFVDGLTNRAIIPGEIFNTVASYTRAGGAWLGSQQFTRSDIKPETAKVWNAGAITEFNFGETQELQITLDYFNIETQDELGLVATTNDIASSVFNAAGLANCSHPLVGRVTFNSPCVQGVTRTGDFASIRTDYGNGPGQHTTGLDLQINYGVSAGPGTLRLGLNVTRQLKNELSETVLDGFVVKAADDRLGDLNFATVGAAQSEWRGNFNVNYAMGDHNIRAVLNYVSGVDDERYINADGSLNTALLTPAGFQPGTTTPFGVSTFGVYGDDWKTVDLHYLWKAPWLTVGFSVANVADEDPPASRQEFGYDPRIGSPLGRQFELSLRKTL